MFKFLLEFNPYYTISFFIFSSHETGQKLAKNLQPLFEGVVIEPCLLHGDLWSGNISTDSNGDPVILDPACYCESLLHRISSSNCKFL